MKCNSPWAFYGNESINIIENIETTPEEVLEVCKDININKASCVDNLSCEILRDAFMINRPSYVSFLMQKNANWHEFEESRNPIRMWEIMKTNIEGIIDTMCPLKTFRINQIKQPWITPPLIELIKDKDKVLKKAKKKKNDENLWKQAKRFRNMCTNRLRKAKADYVKSNLNNNQNNPKKFWKNIQEIFPQKSKNNKNIILTDTDTDQTIESE